MHGFHPMVQMHGPAVKNRLYLMCVSQEQLHSLSVNKLFTFGLLNSHRARSLIFLKLIIIIPMPKLP